MNSAVRASLSALDAMLHDFLAEHAQNPEVQKSLLEHIEAAQRHIGSARTLRSQKAMNDPAEADIKELQSEQARLLSVQEKWLVRTLQRRGGLYLNLLGRDADRLLEYGLIEQVGAKAKLTAKGIALSLLWAK
jgi:hypothetical protein